MLTAISTIFPAKPNELCTDSYMFHKPEIFTSSPELFHPFIQLPRQFPYHFLQPIWVRPGYFFQPSGAGSYP